MIQQTPPLGWNSWNTFGNNIDEHLLFTAADAMIESGLYDAGYHYVVIDDAWPVTRRDKQHRLVADPNKFPHGIKAVSDYIHSKGLKIGMYSCAGALTCGGYPGSYEYEFLDAQTFAEWEVDLLKYDYCYKPVDENGALLYRRMGIALANCGRDILFSACSWGANDSKAWIKTTGAHMWRSTYDVVDSWESIKGLCKQQRDLQPYNGLGCFNDMDMLVVGMNGKGNVGMQGCSFVQYRTHFSLWAFLGSPLMIGCDIRSLDDETRTILMNKELLAINQDAAYRQAYIIGGSQNCIPGGDDDHFTWVKLLSNGNLAIGMFNLSDGNSNMYFSLSELGLNRFCGKKLVMKNLWSGELVETIDGRFLITVAKNDCAVFRAKVVDDV